MPKAKIEKLIGHIQAEVLSEDIIRSMRLLIDNSQVKITEDALENMRWGIYYALRCEGYQR